MAFQSVRRQPVRIQWSAYVGSFVLKSRTRVRRHKYTETRSPQTRADPDKDALGLKLGDSGTDPVAMVWGKAVEAYHVAIIDLCAKRY